MCFYASAFIYFYFQFHVNVPQSDDNLLPQPFLTKQPKDVIFPFFDILNKLEVNIYNYVLYQKNASFPNSIAVLLCVKILIAHSKSTFDLN